jgi:hypothetical protein
MEKILEIQQLLKNNEQLIESNQQLVKTNNAYLSLIEKLNKREEKILKCFGKMYRIINSKNEKTWEEHNHLNELYELITHAEKDGSA